MAKENPETVATRAFRKLLDCRGAFTKKLSDSYTRGIPDLLVSVGRVVLVEMKVDHGHRGRATYKQLGASGAQDQNIRELCRRDYTSSCIVSASPRDAWACVLWLPVEPEMSGRGFEAYSERARGFEEVFQWLRTRDPLT